MRIRSLIIDIFNLIAFVALLVLGAYFLFSKGNFIEESNKSKEIQDYTWFYNQYNLVKVTAIQIDSTTDELNQSDKKMLQLLVKEYNRQAKKQSTKENWKPVDIPYQIKLEKENK